MATPKVIVQLYPVLPAEDRADHVTPSYRFRPRVAPSVRAACAACVTDNQLATATQLT